MKYLRTALLALLSLTVVTMLGTHSTMAQQATSGAASSVISPVSRLLPVRSQSRTQTCTVRRVPRAVVTSIRCRKRIGIMPTQHEHFSPDFRRVLTRTTQGTERRVGKGNTEHFEIRQKIRAHELEELNEQIRRLQALHDRREQDKSQIIGDRMRQLLRDAEGLGWGPNDVTGTTASDIQRHFRATHAFRQSCSYATITSRHAEHIVSLAAQQSTKVHI